MPQAPYQDCIWLTLFLLGVYPSRNQRLTLKSLFISSFPTPKPTFLEKPPAQDAFLFAFYKQASCLVIPRRRRRVPSNSYPTMGKKATKKSSAAETTDAHDKEHQDDTTVFPPSPAPTSSSHGNAELDEEKAGEQIEPSKHQAKQKKAPAANLIEKPSTANPAKGSECGNKEATSKDAKKGQKKSGPPSDSTSVPVPAPTVRPASAREVSFVSHSPFHHIYGTITNKLP